MSPMAGITSATRTTAEPLGIQSDIGALEVSKLADIIEVDVNPVEDTFGLQKNRKHRAGYAVATWSRTTYRLRARTP